MKVARNQCPNCNRPVPEYAYDEHLAVCKKMYKPDIVPIIVEGYYHGMGKQIVQQRKHNRKCVICGKKCWPNFFYCKKHHTGMSALYKHGYEEV